jgi:hypothetical protein
MKPTESDVIQAVRCPHPGCRTPPGRSCRRTDGVYRGRTHVERWQRLEHDLHVGRAALPLELDQR